MVLHKMGFSAIAPQSENPHIYDIENFKTRFRKIVVFYDTDDPGLAAARHLSESLGCPYIVIPSRFHAKDISDCTSR